MIFHNNNVIIMEWTLWEYENAYTSFLENECDTRMRASIDNRLEKLLLKGNQAREPESKNLRDGIFELRAQRGGRLLYFFHPGKKIIVVLGILKDQKKVASKDIDEAIRRKQLAEAEEELSHVTKVH